MNALFRGKAYDVKDFNAWLEYHYKMNHLNWCYCTANVQKQLFDEFELACDKMG